MSVASPALTTPEIAPSHHGEELPPIGKAIIRDFYNSFRFSQGEANLQGHIYEALGDYYASHWDHQERKRVVKILPFLNQRVLRLALPHAHLDKESAVSDEQRRDAADREISPLAEAFRREWRSFSSWHLQMLEDEDAPEMLNRETVAKIAVGIANRDRAYQSKARPNRPENTDLHASYFRDYIVLGQPTGSEAFDTIFAQARDMVLSSDENLVQYTALDLAYKWEANHQGQSFFPDSMITPMPSAA